MHLSSIAADPSLVRHLLRFEVRGETMALFRDLDTDVGRFVFPLGTTGYPVRTDGTTSSDEEASSVVRAAGGHYALVLRSGEGLLLDDHLRPGLKALMDEDSVVWVSAAEASLDQAHAARDRSPHVLAFAADGSDVVDGVYRDGEIAGNAADMEQRSLRRGGSPAAREAFTGVYSRADDLAFVVSDSEVWFRSVEGPLPWTQTRLEQGYSPKRVLAATWSFRDQKLWILDRIKRRARLTRVHPFTGHWDTVGEWQLSNDYHDQWLGVALDGNVILFSSSKKNDAHGAALFHSVALHAFAPVEVARLYSHAGELLFEPTIDKLGMSLAVPKGRDEIEVLRYTELPGRAASIEEVASIL